MIKIKNQRGITLIGLIITIVLMLILTAVAINVGVGDIDYSKRIRFMSYMQAIQKKVDYITEYENYENYGDALTSEQKTKLTTILSNENDTFITNDVNSVTLKYFNSQKIASQLELDNIDDEIIVNFATREVISLNGIEYEDNIYYTQYNLPGGQKIVNGSTSNRSVSFGTPTASINGLNAIFTIPDISITNGTLSYTTNYSDPNPMWTVITDHTIANQPVTTENITKSGTYYFKLEDNTNKTNVSISSSPIYLRLANSPQLKGDLELEEDTYDYSGQNINANANWAYATANSIEYVWIPRFAYETAHSSNIEFLKGTSDLTTSGGYITNDWTVPSIFTDVTGGWIRTDSYSSYDIIDIIETGTIY